MSCLDVPDIIRPNTNTKLIGVVTWPASRTPISTDGFTHIDSGCSATKFSSLVGELCSMSISWACSPIGFRLIRSWRRLNWAVISLSCAQCCNLVVSLSRKHEDHRLHNCNRQRAAVRAYIYREYIREYTLTLYECKPSSTSSFLGV